MTAQPEVAVDRALEYARRGWPVFPCQQGSKVPATRHGFHDATTDRQQIERWWKAQPHANVAIATGSPGPDVLDVDQHGAAGSGFAAYDRLLAAGLVARPSAIVITPSGGLHVYFAGSNQETRRLQRHHLDFRAAGGCVLAPPSQVDGKPYRQILRDAETRRMEWSAVTQLLEPSRDLPPRVLAGRPTDVSRLAGWVEGLQEGNRNSGLFWAACRAEKLTRPACWTTWRRLRPGSACPTGRSRGPSTRPATAVGE